MADHSTIEWTDATWNPVTGCSVVSPGCANCYAMQLAGTRLRNHPSRQGLTTDTKRGPVWNGKLRRNEEWLDQPLRWKRPRRIFVCAHGDLFHEDVPDEWIDKVFAVMALTPHHTFQVLTKRAKRLRSYFSDMPALGLRTGAHLMRFARGNVGAELLVIDLTHSITIGNPLPNVWLGVSVEDQQRADERIPHLLETPAAIRFISAEPLLGPIDLSAFLSATPAGSESVRGQAHQASDRWVIAGGESGKDARPMHPDWARALRDQCAAAGVPFFFKQWGEYGPIQHDQRPYQMDQLGWVSKGGDVVIRATDKDYKRMERDDERRGGIWWVQTAKVGKKAAGNTLDGRQHLEFPRC
jgi:protein gp37